MGIQGYIKNLYNSYKGRNVFKGQHEDTVFTVSSQCNNLADHPPIATSSSTSSLISRQQLCVPKIKGQGSSPVAMQADPNLRLEPELDTDPDPDPGLSAAPTASPSSLSPDAEYDKLLDVEAVPMPDGQLCLLTLPPKCSQGEGPAAMPYLKLFCRYITDRKGVVSGILVVTSNKIFFDPCKTHPLVMEHGCEEYLVSCSVDCLTSVSFYSDISHVHFNSSMHSWKGSKKTQKTFFKTGKTLRQNARQSSSSPPNHKGETVPALVSAATSDLRSTLGLSLDQGVSEEKSCDMAEAERQLEGKDVKSPGALGVAVLSSAATFCCGGQEAPWTENRMKEHMDGVQTEKEQSVRNQTPGPSRPPPGNSGGLMFVRLRLRQSTGRKKGLAAGLQLGTSKSFPYRDSWFTFSQESSDELYAYLSHWRPDLCILDGGLEEGEGDEEDFVLVDDGVENQEEEEEVSKHRGRSGEDWELVSVEDGSGKLPLVFDKEPEGLCEIVSQSHILDESLVREVSAALPARTVGHAWRLSYSTSRHGFSLKSLYRKLSGSDSPVLMVIKDSLNQVFGSFLSHPLRPSETFYGTGETFLFMLHPRFKCFRWTGENSFFIKGDLDSFAIGGGSGHFGLWLDETLYQGRSSPCYTFNNCCLSERDDFHVIELEVWTFW
ncbi:nuclear receptor coactivator 7 isoform X2 [Esox lucius]|uniref:Si:ch211-15d5.11 n=1 Tax=Esox lucius TaxID=8010 RepID=A0AAY5K9X6_ESOLU|nr:nuclear receptor coactivator 7 isoform X2 [Esox lucius]